MKMMKKLMITKKASGKKWLISIGWWKKSLPLPTMIKCLRRRITTSITLWCKLNSKWIWTLGSLFTLSKFLKKVILLFINLLNVGRYKLTNKRFKTWLIILWCNRQPARRRCWWAQRKLQPSRLTNLRHSLKVFPKIWIRQTNSTSWRRKMGKLWSNCVRMLKSKASNLKAYLLQLLIKRQAWLEICTRIATVTLQAMFQLVAYHVWIFMIKVKKLKC